MWKETSPSLFGNSYSYTIKAAATPPQQGFREETRKTVKKKKDGQKTLWICFDMTKDSSDMHRYAVSDGWRKATLDQAIRFQTQVFLAKNTS